MKNILITGATGNVGMEVIKALLKLSLPVNIIAAVRGIGLDGDKLKDYNIGLIKFDVTDSTTFFIAFKNIDVLFLLRPPQISAVKKYFVLLINAAKAAGIKHIVFLSVQGVEVSKIIPHHKIEKRIVASKISFTFLRPAYFMQNFTTTLSNDLLNNKRIYLPAGNAKFTLVDVRDIGNVAAVVLTNVTNHINKSYELTCSQKYNFYEMAEKLSAGLGIKISYESPSLLNFYLAKRKEEMPVMLILIIIMLHYFPRFQKQPAISDCIEKITGDEPITFEAFIFDNKKLLST